MAEIDGGRIAARQLKAAGVDTIFGVVAGPMIEIFAGAQAEGLRVVGCRHEENAAFMASAWGYQKRKPGVVVAGSGPGMTNTVTPMYVATASAMPLVVLGGSTYGAMRGIGGFQEADQVAFAAPGCKWTAQVDSTQRIGELVHLALGKAVSGRPGAVYLDFPGHLVGRRVPEEDVPVRRAPEVARPHPDGTWLGSGPPRLPVRRGKPGGSFACGRRRFQSGIRAAFRRRLCRTRPALPATFFLK